MLEVHISNAYRKGSYTENCGCTKNYATPWCRKRTICMNHQHTELLSFPTSGFVLFIDRSWWILFPEKQISLDCIYLHSYFFLILEVVFNIAGLSWYAVPNYVGIVTAFNITLVLTWIFVYTERRNIKGKNNS